MESLHGDTYCSMWMDTYGQIGQVVSMVNLSWEELEAML